MQYFLDSAKIDEIKYALQNWDIDGVTSNPRHVKASGKPFYTVLREFTAEFGYMEFPISVEINPHLATAEAMVDDAMKIAAISPNFVIKIPCTEQGLVATKRLVENEVPVNVTLVFTATQALQAARVGAAYVSPFIGWQEASGIDCTKLVSDIASIYETYDFDTDIIVAAVRTGKQIVDAALLGADVVTAGFDVYKESFFHPFTSHGLKIFQDAWDDTELGEE